MWYINNQCVLIKLFGDTVFITSLAINPLNFIMYQTCPICNLMSAIATPCLSDLNARARTRFYSCISIFVCMDFLLPNNVFTYGLKSYYHPVYIHVLYHQTSIMPPQWSPQPTTAIIYLQLLWMTVNTVYDKYHNGYDKQAFFFHK